LGQNEPKTSPNKRRHKALKWEDDPYGSMPPHLPGFPTVDFWWVAAASAFGIQFELGQGFLGTAEKRLGCELLVN